jgi:uncharacterized protein (DUF488 family)
VLSGVGYEGRTPEELVSELHEAGVDLVVDVRLNALSRRPGFSKRALAEALAGDGISYVHEPTLGNPAENRPGFRRPGTRRGARDRYRQTVRRRGQAALDRVALHARDSHVALLCVEREAEACHRTVILDLLGARSTT